MPDTSSTSIQVRSEPSRFGNYRIYQKRYFLWLIPYWKPTHTCETEEEAKAIADFVHKLKSNKIVYEL